ncbi:MAG: RNA methyltransferase [Parachlamydiales bacterium]|jgi:TrmH family RNA methyltransferase
MNYNFDITSPHNEKIKSIVKLQDNSKRKNSSFFIIEGYAQVSRAYENSLELDSLFICSSIISDSFQADKIEELINRIKEKNVCVFNCEEKVFDKISYRQNPDGIIAIAKQYHYDLFDLEHIIANKKDPFFIICERLEKPGNLGAILRTADAAGCDAVIVTDPKVDIFNPNVVRSSIGALFSIPIIVSEGEQIIAFMKKKKIEIVATALNAKITHTEIDFKKPVAIVMGTEDIGISDIWLKNADNLIKIPMYGHVDSLNVANAAAIMLYEIVRQRKLS